MRRSNQNDFMRRRGFQRIRIRGPLIVSLFNTIKHSLQYTYTFPIISSIDFQVKYSRVLKTDNFSFFFNR